MIWLGFIFANILGGWLTFYGIAATWFGVGFSGRNRYFLFLLLSVVGVCILYWAWANGPISISIDT